MGREFSPGGGTDAAASVFALLGAGGEEFQPESLPHPRLGALVPDRARIIPVLAVSIGIASSLLKKQGEDQIYQFVDNVVTRIVPPAAVTNSVRHRAFSPTNTPPAQMETNSPLVAVPDSTNALANANPPEAESATNQPASTATASDNDSGIGK